MKNQSRHNMKGILLTIGGCIAFITLFSCANSKKETVRSSLISKWSGKEIQFPKYMYFTVYGKDTIEYPVKHSQYSIISYMDSAGCTSCKLELPIWKEYIYLLSSSSGKEIPVLFFFFPKSKNELTNLLKDNYFNHPICIDEKDSLNKLNGFPTDMAFQTFLLDKDNKVIAIGNPVHNPKIGELYMKIIRQEKVQVNAE